MNSKTMHFLAYDQLKPCLKKGPGHRNYLAKANRLVSKRRRRLDREEIQAELEAGCQTPPDKSQRS